MRFLSGFPLVITAILFLQQAAFATGVEASISGDRHAGYNYPEPGSEETYKSIAAPLPGVTKRSRIAFVTGLDQEQKKRPYAPAYHVFAKGAHSQKLIIIATEDGRYDTLYRLRGLIASLTSDARISPLFTKIGNVDRLNFYDLCRMVGFEWITVTNGRDVAHRIVIE